MVSVALVFTLSYGFLSAEHYRSNLLLITAVTVPLIAFLFLGSWSKRALLPSSLLVVALGVIVIAVAFFSSPVPLVVEGALADNEENYTIFGFILIIIPIAVYLLSRRTAVLVILFVFAALSCGMIQFLYRDWIVEQPGLPVTLAVFLGIAMLFVYQCYKQSIYQAQRVKSTAFGGVLGFSALIGVACLLVGMVVYYGVIAGLGLTTLEIKPFTSPYAREIIYSTGTYDHQETPDKDKATDQTNEELGESQQDADGSEQSGDNGTSSSDENQLPSGLAQLLQAFDAQNWLPEFSPISYEQLKMGAIVAAILITVLALAFILAWRYRRQLRLKRLEKHPYNYRVWYLYHWLLTRFKRLKIAKPNYLTPMEFAFGARRAMAPFSTAASVDFIYITDVFQRAIYGEQNVGAQEYDNLVKYYKAFFKNARAHTGALKWLWKFWRI
jgi:hypothetical protein